MKLLKKKFIKNQKNTQRTFTPKIWWNKYNGPNFSHCSIVFRFWDGYWGVQFY